MRAYELIKETFCRKVYICIVHLVWFAVYGLFFALSQPGEDDFYWFLLVWSGCVLPLVLSAGIFGDDIASGRICVLVTRPFWSGELYVYRFMGLSLQGLLHLVLAGLILLIIHKITGVGEIDGLGLWLLSSWLLFNTWAAISTSVSVVLRRAYNFLFLFAALLFFFFLYATLMVSHRNHAGTGVLAGFIRYAFPPFDFLGKLAKAEYGKHSLIVGQYRVIKSVACVIHSLMLTIFYSIVGMIILSRRQFPGGRS